MNIINLVIQKWIFHFNNFILLYIYIFIYFYYIVFLKLLSGLLSISVVKKDYLKIIYKFINLMIYRSIYALILR